MSQWNSNNVPHEEGQQYLNQPFGNSAVFYNVTEHYDNGCYYPSARFPPNFNNGPRNYYADQHYQQPNDVTRQANLVSERATSSNQPQASSSVLTPTAKEFKPKCALTETASNNKNNGAIKKQNHVRKKKNVNEFDNKSFYRNRKTYTNQEYDNTNEDLYKNNRKQRNMRQKPERNENSNQTDNDNVKVDSVEHGRNRNYKSKHMNEERYPQKNQYYNNSGKYYRSNGYYNDGMSRDTKYVENDYDKNKKSNIVDQTFTVQKIRERKERNFKENWRSDSKPKTRYDRKNENRVELKKKLDAASQRERLKEMVVRKLLDCLVCYEFIRHTDEVWSCNQCYHILHLTCIIKWAKSSKMETGWRCPACQNMNVDIPKDYVCFCGNVRKPTLEPSIIPHSCGETCGRKGRSCEHTCTLLCHPGPCPDCSVIVTKSCNCGNTQMQAVCSAVFELVCKKQCNKILNCGMHKCQKVCHLRDCEPCGEFIKQECYCGKLGRKVQCTSELNGETQFACEDKCMKKLDCGNHYCQKQCHPGQCDPCEKTPSKIQFCPCGQTMLTEKRSSCLDPIPCCDKICNKPLKCGQPSMPHQCKNKCHDGPCSTCSLTTMVRCRCGHMDRELMCSELTTKADDARCQKRCTKKRQCSKHKCNQLCCIDIDHVCPLICNHNLSCGLHRCEETCHRGRCPPCWRTSFQELYCECGSSVLYPPVACGTRPPPCSQPCSRPRECGHDVTHNCHTGPCPPCTILTVQWCYGNHEKRATIPCHQGQFSCGIPCGKELPCGRHKCKQLCHTGPCPLPCTQLCTFQRDTCSHPCNAPCHEPPCPDTPCKQTVKVSCDCGLRSSTRTCMDLAGEYQSIAMSQLASKMADIQRGQTVDITDLVSNQKRMGTLKTLECNEECKIVERNRKLTIGLQIRNPDLSSKLAPRYSDYMRMWGKKDPRFCQNVHDKLSELVRLAKQSKQKSRAHSFESMNRDKRHFIHEYSEHFGCESAAYDQEPNRNVVATAFRDKSWLPSLSLLEVLQRENGQRKVPGPVLSKSATGKSESVSLNKLPARIPRPPTPVGEYVDYFNNPQ